MKKIVAAMAIALAAGMTFASPAEAGTYSKNENISAWVHAVKCKKNGNAIVKVRVKNETKREKMFYRDYRAVTWTGTGASINGATNNFYVKGNRARTVRFKVKPDQLVSFSIRFKNENILGRSGVNADICAR